MDETMRDEMQEVDNVGPIQRYYHEAEVARLELDKKRWFHAWLITFILLVCCVAGFIWYESQWEDIVMTQEATTDGGGNAVVNGVASGDLYYGESEANNQDAPPQNGR